MQIALVCAPCRRLLLLGAPTFRLPAATPFYCNCLFLSTATACCCFLSRLEILIVATCFCSLPLLIFAFHYGLYSLLSLPVSAHCPCSLLFVATTGCCCSSRLMLVISIACRRSLPLLDAACFRSLPPLVASRRGNVLLLAAVSCCYFLQLLF